jgi:hypothetical protein
MDIAADDAFRPGEKTRIGRREAATFSRRSGGEREKL